MLITIYTTQVWQGLDAILYRKDLVRGFSAFSEYLTGKEGMNRAILDKQDPDTFSFFSYFSDNLLLL